MAVLNKENLEIVKDLYYVEKMSMKAIATKLEVSLDSVCYFMRKNKLDRRSVAENEAIKFRNKPLSYKLMSPLNNYHRDLKSIGTILYWGEGYKTSRSMGVDFANSDPSMVEVFMRFLREICSVDEKRLRILLYCYSNQNVPELIDFWSKLTKIPRSQFTKPYVREDFSQDKQGKMKYGMVHVRYSDKKLLFQIMKWIEEFKKKYCVGTQVVNEDAL